MHSVLSLTGCTASQPAPPPAPSLTAADQALAANSPNEAISDAQSYLRANPHGPQAALAWYFQGRGYEMKLAPDPAGLQQNEFQASSCYLQALENNPASALEGDIRSSLANAYFFQDKFADAIYQATNAIPLVSSEQVKSVLLLRIGESEQRLSRFSDADQTFRKVQRMYPNSPVAESAKEHEGQTTFYVQLASYKDANQADAAIGALQGIGEVISKRTYPNGVTIIDAGSYPNYNAAKQVRDRLLKNYPYAVVVP